MNQTKVGFFTNLHVDVDKVLVCWEDDNTSASVALNDDEVFVSSTVAECEDDKNISAGVNVVITEQGLATILRNIPLKILDKYALRLIHIEELVSTKNAIRLLAFIQGTLEKQAEEKSDGV